MSENTQCPAECSATSDQCSSIQLLLSKALNSTEKSGSAQLLTQVLSAGEPQVERVFGRQAELRFIEGARNEKFRNINKINVFFLAIEIRIYFLNLTF